MRIYKTSELMEQGTHIHVFSSRRLSAEATHTHDFIEIVYITQGKCVEVIDGVRYPVGHGDLLFMNYGCTHAFETEGEFCYINICFSPEAVGRSLITAENAFSLLCLTAFDEMRRDAGGGKISFFGNERKEIEDLLHAMLKEYRAKLTSWDTVVENYLNILMTRLLRKTEQGVGQKEIGDAWQELSEYIDANLHTELSLSALAQKCFYNPSYFSRIFKEKFGMSLVEYVTRKRLDAAVRLLCDTELSVDTISRRVGFSDRSAFYHAFSRYVGGTPTEYRMLRESKKITQNEPKR